MRYARGTRPQHSCQSIHSAEILQSHSSRHSLCCNHTVALIHHHLLNSSIIMLTVFTRPQERANAPVSVRAPISSRSLLSSCRAPPGPSCWVAAPRYLTVRAAEAKKGHCARQWRPSLPLSLPPSLLPSLSIPPSPSKNTTHPIQNTTYLGY